MIIGTSGGAGGPPSLVKSILCKYFEVFLTTIKRDILRTAELSHAHSWSHEVFGSFSSMRSSRFCECVLCLGFKTVVRSLAGLTSLCGILFRKHHREEGPRFPKSTNAVKFQSKTDFVAVKHNEQAVVKTSRMHIIEL